MRRSVESMLGFPPTASELSESARELFKPEVLNRFRAACKELEALRQGAPQFGEARSSLAVVELFFEWVDRDPGELALRFRSARSLEALSWSLASRHETYGRIADTMPHLEAALQLLGASFRKSYVPGIIETVCSHWRDELGKSLRLGLRSLQRSGVISTSRLGAYKKIWERVLQDEGDALLAEEFMAIEDQSVSFLDHLALPARLYSCDFVVDYVAHVIRQGSHEYLMPDDAGQGFIDYLRAVDNRGGVLRCMCEWIVSFHDDGRQRDPEAKVFLQNGLRDLAIELVGDPSSEAAWLPPRDSSADEIALIESARRILLTMVVEDILNLVFREVYVDEARRKFWIRYASEIHSVKIFAGRSASALIRRSQGLKQVLKGRLGTLRGGTSQQSAIIMEVNRHVLVEFLASGGAFYGYRKGSPKCPSIASSEVGEIDLKNRDVRRFNLSSPNSGAYQEGRMTHTAGWERDLRRWLSSVVGVDA